MLKIISLNTEEAKQSYMEKKRQNTTPDASIRIMCMCYEGHTVTRVQSRYINYRVKYVLMIS